MSNKFKNTPIYLIFFLTFLGYYVVLLFLFSAGLSKFSRSITIPLRLLISLILLYFLINNLNRIKIFWQTKIFLFFSLLYLIRIVIDDFFLEQYYLSTLELFFYFMSFSIIPFFTISVVKIGKTELNSIAKALFFSSIFFAFLSVFNYGKFIGKVTRLNSSTAGEDVISPLALSYCATFVIGFLVSYLMNNKVSSYVKFFSFLAIGFAIIPFFLGASRGGIFALFIPFIFMFFNGGNLFVKLGKALFIFFVLIFVLIYLDSLLQSGLLERFTNTSDDIEKGANEAIRVEIWKSSIDQFLNNPFFGDKLRVNGWGGYAHNIFIEALQTMGFFGFVPLFILIFNAFKISFSIFRYNKEYAWLSIIFIQAFIQHIFSGAIYTASWLWTSMALLFSINELIKNTKYEN